MSVTYSGGALVVTGGDRPVIDPDATCEGCSSRGTVGRAARGDAASKEVEEHRFCADCWPEWSAFYRARWEEQTRRVRLAWRDRADGAEGSSPPTATGMWFESATWHGVIEFVRRVTMQARYHRDPPSPEALARFAAGIRAQASEKVGPMPLEVRAFLAEFGQGDSQTPGS